MYLAIFPEDLIYEISLFLLPKTLIKLSLCSKYLRRTILNDQCIWRAQYYKEWPAFFTSCNSNEDTLFPTPMWIQTFFMRKISELNIEKWNLKTMVELRDFSYDHSYYLFQDLTLLHKWYEDEFIIYKNQDQKVTEFSALGNFRFLYTNIHCGNSLIVCSKKYGIHCFSMTGEYAKIDSDIFCAIFSVDKNHFIGITYKNVDIFTVTDDGNFQQCRLEFPAYSVFLQIHGRPGCFASVKFDESTEKTFTWSMWDFRTCQPKLIMKKHFTCKTKASIFESYSFADCDFVFISFRTDDHICVYVYSFKEDRSKIFVIVGDERDIYRIVVFYTSTWNSMVSHNFYHFGKIIWICFSGTTLDSLRFVYDIQRVSWMNLFQFSKRSLSIVADRCFQVIDMCTGNKTWEKNIEVRKSKPEINSKYIICDDHKIYDFSPRKPPEINEWLYKLFL